MRFEDDELTVHIAEQGDDGNPGSERLPLATFEQAMDVVADLRVRNPRDPVTVLVHGGVYHLEQPIVFSPDASGTPAAQIVYTAAPGETVVLSGGLRLEADWQPFRDGIWACRLPDVAAGWLRFDQLFVDGQRQTPVDAEPAAPGQWRLDRGDGVLSCLPADGGAALRDAVVEVACLPCLVAFEGSSHEPVHDIVLEGFEFMHTSGRDPAERRSPAAVSFEGARNCAVERSVFRGLGAGGAAIGRGCSRIRVEDNRFRDLLGDAVCLTNGRDCDGPDGAAPEREWPTECTISGNSVHRIAGRPVYLPEALAGRNAIHDNRVADDVPNTGRGLEDKHT